MSLRRRSDPAGHVITINTVLGALVAGALFWQGQDQADVLMWGTISDVLNCIPRIGPVTGVLALAVVGVVAFDTPRAMRMPAALYRSLGHRLRLAGRTLEPRCVLQRTDACRP